MERREFLTLGAATVALGTLSERTAAQIPTTGWKNHLDAYSRTLHWLRTPGEVAAACHDWSQPYQKMLDAMKPRVEPLAKLLGKYKVKACYHPGGGFTEILDLCRAFDSRDIAIDYDTGNFGQFNQGALVNQIRIGGPYIGSIVFKDFVIERTDGAPPGGAGDAGRAGGAAGGRGGRGGGSPNGWSSRQVPVGTGVLNLPVICQALKEINFQGPIECQPE